MADDSFDIRCANTCSRAGLVALTFTILAFSLVNLLIDAERLDAFQKYLRFRYDLKNRIESLYASPCWKSWQSDMSNKGQNIEEYRLYDFLQKQNMTLFSPMKVLHFNPDNQTRIIAMSCRLYEIPEISQISDLFCIVDNTKLIQLAEQYSFQSGNLIKDWNALLILGLIEENNPEILDSAQTSLYRWSPDFKRIRREINSQANNRSIPDNKTTVSTTTINTKTIDKSTAITKDLILRNLSIGRIKKISGQNLDNEFQNVIGKSTLVNVPSVSIPVDIKMSSGLIESIILFSMIYFWLFLNEAKRSDGFPAPGTMFGVFKRTFFTNLLFLCLASCPAVSAWLLWIFSYSYQVYILTLTISITFFTLLIIKDFFNVGCFDLRVGVKKT